MVPAVLPGVSLPADLSAVEVVPFSVPAAPVGQESLQEVGVDCTTAGTLVRGVVSMTDVSSVTCQDELDVPLSKLISLSQRPHAGDGDPPVLVDSATTEKAPAGVTVESEGHKTTSPRFSSFLPVFRVDSERHATKAGFVRS